MLEYPDATAVPRHEYFAPSLTSDPHELVDPNKPYSFSIQGAGTVQAATVRVWLAYPNGTPPGKQTDYTFKGDAEQVLSMALAVILGAAPE